MVIGTSEWLSKHLELLPKHPEAQYFEVKESELASLSTLQTPGQVLLVVPMPEPAEISICNEWYIALDDIQDPGNMGTIVRLADWFGIRNIICSEGCADLYNPKVVQSTMGAFARVKVHYVPLIPFLEQAKLTNIPIYGTFLDGENLYASSLTANGIVVMGNEGNGISDIVANSVSRKINIPSFPPGEVTSESLNVAIATSVICAEFRRRIICTG